MSILIKGIEMPKSCYECAFCLWDAFEDDDTFTCLATDGEFGTARKNERQYFCPLVEIQPHGRLIDADALIRKVPDVYVFDYKVDVLAEGYSENMIQKEPTIIEAEAME